MANLKVSIVFHIATQSLHISSHVNSVIICPMWLKDVYIMAASLTKNCDFGIVNSISRDSKHFSIMLFFAAVVFENR